MYRRQGCIFCQVIITNGAGMAGLNQVLRQLRGSMMFYRRIVVPVKNLHTLYIQQHGH